MDKIYSRNKFRFRYNKRLKKKFTVILILIVILVTMYLSMNSVLPVFDKLCQDKAQIIATKIANEKSSEVISKYKYDDLFEVQKDEKGAIKMITANTYDINLLTSNIANQIDEALNEESNQNIKIRIRKLFWK